MDSVTFKHNKHSPHPRHQLSIYHNLTRRLPVGYIFAHIDRKKLSYLPRWPVYHPFESFRPLVWVIRQPCEYEDLDSIQKDETERFPDLPERDAFCSDMSLKNA